LLRSSPPSGQGCAPRPAFRRTGGCGRAGTFPSSARSVLRCESVGPNSGKATGLRWQLEPLRMPPARAVASCLSRPKYTSVNPLVSSLDATVSSQPRSAWLAFSATSSGTCGPTAHSSEPGSAAAGFAGVAGDDGSLGLASGAGANSGAAAGGAGSAGPLLLRPLSGGAAPEAAGTAGGVSRVAGASDVRGAAGRTSGVAGVTVPLGASGAATSEAEKRISTARGATRTSSRSARRHERAHQR
jgi:hypothetical protein